MRKLTALALGLSLTLGAAPAMAQCDPGETVIKFSHVVNGEKHPKGIAANLFAERVNTALNGKACMQVFANSSLYNDDKVLEAMLNGDVQFAAPSLSKFEVFTKKFRIFDLPFLFATIDAVDKFQQSPVGDKLLNSMRRRGLLGLAYWHNGMKQLSANKPLLVPADAAGLKFRVQPSEVLVAQFQALNANPQKMAFSEVYGALQTKVVDGQENTWSNIYGQKFFEVQDGTTETNHGVIDYLVVVSTDWWDGLDAGTRDTLAKILREVTDERNAVSTQVNEEAKQAIIAAGGKIRTLTPDQRKAWVGAMKPVWAKFEDDIGADLIKDAQSFND
ncbi:MAG: TRAP transporter substrate-binding protein [Burkholderiaceae bacterium]